MSLLTGKKLARFICSFHDWWDFYGEAFIFRICRSWWWKLLYYHSTKLANFKQLSSTDLQIIMRIIWVISGYFEPCRRLTDSNTTAFTLKHLPETMLIHTTQLMRFKSLRKYSSFAWWVKYHKISHFPESISCIEIPIQCITTF